MGIFLVSLMIEFLFKKQVLCDVSLVMEPAELGLDAWQFTVGNSNRPLTVIVSRHLKALPGIAGAI